MKHAIRSSMGLLILAALLAGCAAKPEVLPAGKGTGLYVIAGQPDLNAAASRRADQYCEKHGQTAVIQDGGYKESGFTFRCATL
jgi:hypothetical protein